MTPLMLAVRIGKVDAVKEILKIPGVDLHTTNAEGKILEEIESGMSTKRKIDLQYSPNLASDEKCSDELWKKRISRIEKIQGKNMTKIVKIIWNARGENQKEKKEEFKRIVEAKQFYYIECQIEHLKLDEYLSFVCSYCKERCGNPHNIDVHEKVYKKFLECSFKPSTLPGHSKSSCACCYLDEEENPALAAAAVAHYKAFKDETKCNVCGTKTKTKLDLDRHIREIHMKSAKDVIHCKYDDCDFETVRQSNLDRHINETHQKSEQNPLECNICEYKTVRKHYLDKHIK